MARIRFLKEGEPSQKKNYRPLSVKFKRYMYISILINIIQGLATIYLFLK